MRLLHRLPDRTRELELRVAPGTDPDVAELAAALGLPDDDLFVDGRFRAPSESVSEAGLTEGSVVAHTPPPDSRSDDTGATLGVVGGICSGAKIALGRERTVVGAAPAADMRLDCSTVSAFHLGLDPRPDGARLTDLDSRNGTLVDGQWVLEPTDLTPGQVIDLGACHLAIRLPVDDAPLGMMQVLGRTPSGTFPFNRPPRRAAAATPPAIVTPAAPRASTHRALFSWASFIAPLVFGLLMAMFFNPLFALFALLSPVMAVATWAESRRRSSKESKRSSAGLRRALARMAPELDAARAAEQTRRRTAHPDPAEVGRRASAPSTRLWERRLDHPDALELVVGTGDLVWEPELAVDGAAEPADGVADLLAEGGPLRAVPIIVEAGPSRVIGLVGPRTTTLAIARWLVMQAAVHHGPADLAIRVAAVGEGARSWGWASWLPHTKDRATGGRTRTIAVGRDEISAMAAAAAGHDGGGDDHVELFVIDGDGLAAGRSSPARALLGGLAGPTGSIVLASTLDRLPSMCTTVVEVTDPDGLVRVSRPGVGEVIDDVLATGVDLETATSTARHLARLDDPELALADASIPANVSLVELLGMAEPDARAIEDRWSRTRGTDELHAPIGADGHGVLEVDLVRDGPHGLVGGTTGSGKSELLRSLVASLAASADSDHLNFVLIDYKGGSAFDCCASLPHTVGLVTDLDEHLGARALRCLEAELHRRERLLRAAGVDDIGDYLRQRVATDRGPLPRLVVVIDEFATMAAELPDFIDALVGIAQRGRSLGVHLLLATQRPSGAVNANIRTNTNLRIALRVLDPGDSTDVIDVRDAASIGRDQPGRAYARFGPGEVVAFQSALVTGTTPARPAHSIELIELADGRASKTAEPAAVGGRADLDRLVHAIGEAHRNLGLAAPRRPWPDPLPEAIWLGDLPEEGSAADAPAERSGPRAVAIGLTDEPDQQRQTPAKFDPADGNAIVLGIPGSGTTTALATIALAMAARHSADELHLYAIDHGAGGLGPLRDLPHCGAVANASEPERQARLIRHLAGEVGRRRGLESDALRSEPSLLALIDNLGGFRSEYEESRDYELVDQLNRVYADGPPLGIHVVAAADQPNAAPRTMTAVTSQIWLMRFTDPSDYAAYGVRPGDTSAMPSGRAFRSETGEEIQLALPHREGLRAAVEEITEATTPPHRPPTRIGVLPVDVARADLDRPPALTPSPAFLPIGLGDDQLATVGFELHDGEHALIAGPARSGKSTALVTIGRLAAEAGARVIALAGRRSPLATIDFADCLVAGADSLVAAIEASAPGTIALVDDADHVDDPTAALAAVLGRPPPGVHLVAAGRADRLRSAYGHWTTSVRSSRTGVLLSPDVLDGDLLGAQLPPRVQLPPLPGRGWLVANGSIQVCQLAAGDAVDAVTTDSPGATISTLATEGSIERAPQRSKRVRSS